MAAPAVTPVVALIEQSAASNVDDASRFISDKELNFASQTVFGAASSAAPNETPLVDRVRDKAADMVATAMNFIGVPYRRGGTSAERGFDCSGFTREVFESSLGLILPHRADQQAKTPGLIQIMRDELRPGDLVFFNTLRRTFSHVGIYIGDGKFIHAPRPGGEVRVEDMRFSYWAKRFTGARRAEPMAAQPVIGDLSTQQQSVSAATLSAATPPLR